MRVHVFITGERLPSTGHERKVVNFAHARAQKG